MVYYFSVKFIRHKQKLLEVKMLNVENLNLLCSLLQIVGLMLIVFWKYLPSYVGAFISVAGFAATVKVFLPVEGSQNILTMTAAVIGIVLIVFGAQLTQKR